MAVTNSFFDRLMLLKNHSGAKSERKFAETIGITPDNWNSYKRGSIPSITILMKILRSIEGLSADWLLFGKGPMILPPEQEVNIVNNEQHDYAVGEITISSDEYREMKRQISDLIATNRNLSEVVREKNSAGSA